MFFFHFYFQTDNRRMDDIFEGNNMTEILQPMSTYKKKKGRELWRKCESKQRRNKLDNTITSSSQISQMRQQQYLNK
jgi:hypothetical protein